MARNSKKFHYVTIGLPRNSPVLERLLDESRKSGVSLAKLIPVKLNEWYSGISAPRPVEPEVKQPVGVEANALAFLENED